MLDGSTKDIPPLIMGHRAVIYRTSKRSTRLSLAVRKGESLGIVGESGSG